MVTENFVLICNVMFITFQAVIVFDLIIRISFDECVGYGSPDLSVLYFVRLVILDEPIILLSLDVLQRKSF
jgi:hypothetical protein